MQTQPPWAHHRLHCFMSQCCCWLLKASMLSCWQSTRLIFFQLSLKAYYIRAQERCACPSCVLMVSVTQVMWGNWPLLIMHSMPHLRAPVDPSSGERCMGAMGLKPQLDDSQKRYCLLGPHSWTHDGGTPRTYNES